MKIERLRNYFAVLTAVTAAFLSLPSSVLAFCPVCVVSVGAGVGIFRWLGVDDSIIGLWLGGFIVSTAILVSRHLMKKWLNFKLRFILSLIVFYPLVLILFYWRGFLNLPDNKIFGIDKLIFGMTIGGLLLAITPAADRFLRKRNNGKIFVSHQKVLVTIFLLFVFSLAFYFITK